MTLPMYDSADAVVGRAAADADDDGGASAAMAAAGFEGGGAKGRDAGWCGARGRGGGGNPSRRVR
jgi:hypothetical protein